MVKKFRGVILGLVVGALSLVFIVQFGGPQSKGCSAGQGTGPAATVYGKNISRSELQSAYILNGGENYPDEMSKQYKLREMVLQGLVERDLLASEARKLGYSVTEEEILQRMAEDGIVYRSMSVNAGPYLPPSGPQRIRFENSKGQFDKDNLRNFVQYRLRRGVQDFTRDQIEETLAQRMRDTVTSSVTIGEGELWDAFVREKESVKLKYVRLSPVYYGQQIKPSEAEITAFLNESAKAVDDEYEKKKSRYTGLEKQVRARHVLLKVDANASAADKAKVRAKAEAVVKRARAGEDFGKLASTLSEDAGTAKKGGDLGFNPKGRMVKAFDDAQFAMQPGQISDVIETPFGFHVIKVEAIREGDVPLPEARHEIAEQLLRDRRASALAEESAKALLAKAKAGATLEDAAKEAAQSHAAGRGEATSSDPLAPEVRETRPFGRADSAIAGPFDSSPLVKAGYDLTPEHPLGDAPLKLGDEWFVYRLESRTNAERDAFTDKEHERLAEALLRRKQGEVLQAYVRGLRDQALASKDLEVEAVD